MRPRVQEIEAAGGRVVVIGSGFPAMARVFAERSKLPETMLLLVDPSLRAFALAGLKRSKWATLNPLSGIAWIRAFRRGHRQGRQAGDNWQQGGALVVAPGGKVTYSYVSKRAGDHPPGDALVAAVARAA